MLIKKSDLSLDDFKVMACNFTTKSPAESKKKTAFVDLPVDIDFKIDTHVKNKSKISITISLNSDTADAEVKARYTYSIVARSFFTLKGISKLPEDKVQQYIFYSALPIAINMVRSFLCNLSLSYPHGQYLLPSIDLVDLFEKKYRESKSKS